VNGGVWSSAMQRPDLERLRHAVLHLHKAIVDDVRGQLERVEGRLTPHAFLDRLMHDPDLAWLKPLSAVIVAMDEWLEGDAAGGATADDAAAAPAPEPADDLAAELRRLLVPDAAGDGFARRYAALLQDSPAIVLAHAGVVRALPPA